MAQIAWTTPAGDLGTYPELREFSFQLEADNPLTSALTYTVVSGDLPPGTQLYPTGLIYGIPNVSVPGDTVARKYKFTIRAKNANNQIADRSFSISINSIVPPTLNIPTESLGAFFDGDYVRLELAFTATNDGQPLTWSVTSGTLPPGLSLSQTGVITGFAEAPPAAGPAGTAAYDVGRYDEFVWDFEGASVNRIYRFGIRLFDGILSAEKFYTITINTKSYFRTDNILITADSTLISADRDGYQYPIITTTQDQLESIRQDRGYAFQFKSYYSNPNVPVYWKVVGSGPAVFDQGAPPVPDEQGLTYELSPYDAKGFDQANLSLPPGLVLDKESGWLFGTVGLSPANKSTYTFILVAYVEIPVSETRVSIRESKPIQFTIDLLADIDNFITWDTDSDLGIIENGELSTLNISATANRGNELFYSIKSGRYGRLPQGLRLLDSGNISGRTSFDFFSMDRSSFQVTMDDGSTTWDTKYTFTVLAQDASGEIFDTREFHLTVRNVNIKPYENLYMKALLPKDLRERFRTTVNNPSLVPEEIVYRPDDPYFGLNKELKFLAMPGIKASSFAKYIESMNLFHRNKRIRFGTLKKAVARDQNLNVKYEVIYIDVLDFNTKAAGIKALNLSRNEQLRRITDAGTLTGNETGLDDYGSLFVGLSTSQDYGAVDTPLSTENANQNVSFSNSFGNMTGELIDNIGYEFQGALPEWMKAIQPDTGQPLGFIRAAVLAYIKPGEGDKALFRYSAELEASGFGINALINQYSFEADRYVLDRALTINYDPDTQKFAKASTTTFDRIPSIGQVDTGPWTRTDIGLSNELRAVDFGDNEYVAVGTGATILTSTNGQTWRRTSQVIDLGYSAGVIETASAGSDSFNFIYPAQFSLGDEILNDEVFRSSQRSYITEINYNLKLTGNIQGSIPSGTTIEFLTFNGTVVTANTTTFTANGSNILYLDDLSNVQRGFSLRIAGINVDRLANVIIKNATTNEVQLSANLTNVIPAGSQITFDDLRGNVVSLITASTAANNTANLTFTTSTANVGIGSFASMSNVALGNFVQTLNANITVTQPCINAVPLGSTMSFASVITANVTAGDATINLSSTDRIGIGSSVIGPQVTSETFATTAFWNGLPSPGNFLDLYIPTNDIIGTSPYVGMTVRSTSLPVDSRIVSVTTFGANTVVNISFATTTVTGNPISKSIIANSVTGNTAPTISTKQTFVAVNSNVGLSINDVVISANIALEDNIRIIGLLANGNVLINNIDSTVKITTGEVVSFVKPTVLAFETDTIVPVGTVVTAKTATSVTLSQPLLANVNIGEDQLLGFGLSETDINFVLYNGHEWYATGSKGLVLRRDIDKVWSQGFAVPYGDVYGMAVGPGPVYIIVGNEGLLARSFDFITWTRINTGSGVNFNSIEYNDSYWVVVGNNGTILVSIDDGASWTINNSLTNKNIYSIKYLNNNWIAVGEKGLVMISVDTASWNVYSAGVTFTLRDVAYIRNQYVVVGDRGTILESIEGTTWSTRLSYQTDNLLSIANNTRAPVIVGSNGLILVESSNFLVNYAIRNVSFEMFNYNTLEELAAIGYPVQEGDTVIFAQQENFDATQYRGESFRNQGWNAYNEIFDDETASLAFDSGGYDNITVIPGYVENLLDPTISNQRAGIWRVALNKNNIAFLVFVRQVQFDQIITISSENNKLVYDPIVPAGGTVPTYRSLNKVVNDSNQATVFDTNSTRFSEPRDQYLADPNTHDRYLKFPSTGVIS